MRAYFVVPMIVEKKFLAGQMRPVRYCAMRDEIPTGDWSQLEIEGDLAVVGIEADEDVLSVLETVFERLPDTGVTPDEMPPALGALYSLDDVLNFVMG